MQKMSQSVGGDVAKTFPISKMMKLCKENLLCQQVEFKKIIFLHRVANEEEEEYGYFTLTFNIEFPHDNDTVYFAHSYPYTYSDLQVCAINKSQN